MRLLYRPSLDELPRIFSSYGVDYDQRVLPSIGNEVLKAVVAQYDAGELITQREMVSENVREQLVKRASDFGIVLDDVAITHLSFSYEFTHAIEAKQVAQQEAERSRYYVEKVLFFFSLVLTLRYYSICFRVHILKDSLLFYVCS